VCTEAGTVLRTVALDLFFNCWYLEIPSDNVPRCAHSHAQCLRLGTLQNLQTWIGPSQSPFVHGALQYRKMRILNHARCGIQTHKPSVLGAKTEYITRLDSIDLV
jgi:hypothetical protein